MPDANDPSGVPKDIRGPRPAVKTGRRQTHQVFGGGAHGQGYAIATATKPTVYRKPKRKKRKAATAQKSRLKKGSGTGQKTNRPSYPISADRVLSPPIPTIKKDPEVRPVGEVSSSREGVSRGLLLVVCPEKLTAERIARLEAVLKDRDPSKVYCFGHRSLYRVLKDKFISAAVIEVSNEANVSDIERNPRVFRFELF